jgi:thiamine biosynthesis lipoprotein
MRSTLILLLLMISARGTSGETVVLRGAAQGTTYHIKYVEPAKGIDQQRLQADVENVFSAIDRQMSTYRTDSEISRFNRAAAGEWHAISAATAKVVATANEISEKTDGAMDVTVGPLVRLWHFGPPAGADGRNEKLKQEFRPPSEVELLAVRKRVGYKRLEVRQNPPALRKKVDGVEVDLSSIAPGYAIDQLSELLLRRHGIKDSMVELGGEVRAAGKREDGTQWRVAIERPIVGRREMKAALPLVNAALSTAGGTHKFFEYGGRRYSHIVDPANGRPVEHALASVSVAADTCLEADGWDTPLTVLGPERGVECAERNAIAAMFISPADDGDRADKVTTTAAWRKRFGEPGK